MNTIFRYLCAREIGRLVGKKNYGNQPLSEWFCQAQQIREQLDEMIKNPTRYGVRRGNVVDYMPALEKVGALSSKEDAVFAGLVSHARADGISIVEALLQSGNKNLRLFAIGLGKRMWGAKAEIIPLLEQVTRSFETEEELKAATSALETLRSADNPQAAQSPTFKLIGVEAKH